MTGELTLICTNDLHGALTEERAEMLARAKAAHAPALLLDSGDAVACGNVSWSRSGEPAHDLMNRAGYDAGAMGNREFHFRARPQLCKLRRAGFPILCANIAAPAGWGGTTPAVVLTPLQGLRVLVFGLLVPMIPPGHWAQAISPVRFADPVAAAQRVVAEHPAELVICLSHLGERRDAELARALPQIDIIAGGHSHTPVREPRSGAGPLVTQNVPHGGSVTIVRVTLRDGRVDAIAATVFEEWPAAVPAGSEPKSS